MYSLKKKRESGSLKVSINTETQNNSWQKTSRRPEHKVTCNMALRTLVRISCNSVPCCKGCNVYLNDKECKVKSATYEFSKPFLPMKLARRKSVLGHLTNGLVHSTRR